MDLSSFINKAHCECLNESDEHTLDDALSSQGAFLESDCDEQVMFVYIIQDSSPSHDTAWLFLR